MKKTCYSMSKSSPVYCTIMKCTGQPCIVKRRIKWSLQLIWQLSKPGKCLVLKKYGNSKYLLHIIRLLHFL